MSALELELDLELFFYFTSKSSPDVTLVGVGLLVVDSYKARKCINLCYSDHSKSNVRLSRVSIRGHILSKPDV